MHNMDPPLAMAMSEVDNQDNIMHRASDGGDIDNVVVATGADVSPVGDATTKSPPPTTTSAPVATSTTTTTTSTSNRFENENLRAKFDHSSRKVVVHNVLKFIRSKDVSKLTSSWINEYNNNSNSGISIQIVNARKPPKDSWIKVTLAEECMVNPFIAFINSGGIDGKALVNERGRPLFAKRVDDMIDDNNNNNENKHTSLQHHGEGKKWNDAADDEHNNGPKRKGTFEVKSTNGDNSTNPPRSKRFKEDAPQKLLSDDEVRDAITPLWRLSYEEQLTSKIREMVNKCANKIVKEIRGKFRILEKEAKRGHRKETIKLYGWLNENRAINMQQPVPSPQKSEYRNKVEFTFGYQLVPDEKDEVEKEDEREGGVISVENGANEESTTSFTAADAEGTETDNNVDKAATIETNTTTNTYRKVPAVGFLAQGWAGGVYPPHPLQNIPNWSCSIADILNSEFLPKSSIPPYDSRTHRGVWRSVTIRASLRTKECMIIVLHAPARGGAGARVDGSDDYSTVFEQEKARLVGLLTMGLIPSVERSFPIEDHDGGEIENSATALESKGNPCVNEVSGVNGNGIRVTSIFFQEYEGLSNPSPDHPVQHIYGKEFIEEKLGNCTFQISPGAFFQVNTDGAEVLYNVVVDRIREVTSDPMQTLLLDVCCGTGTIGITCLKEGVVGKLVGVDIAEPAIADAKLNASKNGYTDKSLAQFIASPAEKILPDIMRDIPRNTPVVAVVDPARDGLHGTVIRTLRANEKIRRLVYVSCNPIGTLTRDAAMLCGPPTKKYPGIPFKPTVAQPVDMFPLTKHCEIVMTFDRMSKEEYEKYHS